VKITKYTPHIIGVALTCCVVILITTNTRSHIQSEPITVRGITYEHSKSGVQVAIFTTPLELSTTWQEAGSLQQTAKQQAYQLAVNGTYFKGQYSQASPAGFFYEGGVLGSPIIQDPQLSRIVSYSRKENNLQFLTLAEFNLANNSSDFSFQTGPQILVENVVQEKEIADSINGLGGYRRTFLGRTSLGAHFFGVTTAPLSLPELGRILTEMKVFKNLTISVVNLDGGPSVAMYSRDLARVNVNISMQLPLVIGTARDR
jgi:exopolysaccharide biosynthesis protein